MFIVNQIFQISIVLGVNVITAYALRLCEVPKKNGAKRGFLEL